MPMRRFALGACAALLLASEASAQGAPATLELRAVPLPAVAPTDPVGLLAELVNTGARPLEDVTLMGATYSFGGAEYESELFGGIDTRNVVRGVALAPGGRVRFLFAGLYPKQPVKPGVYRFQKAQVTVQAAGLPGVVLVPAQPFAVEVSEQAPPLAALAALGVDALPPNRQRLSDAAESRARVAQSDTVALVEIAQVRAAADATEIHARVLEPVRGAAVGELLAVRARYAQGCRWRIFPGHYLAFLKRDGAGLAPLDCQGALLPVRNTLQQAQQDWATGTLDWIEIKEQRWPRSMSVRDVVRELKGVHRQLEAETAKLERSASLRESSAPASGTGIPLAPPNAFRDLPHDVRAFLHAQGCSVPQPWQGPEDPLVNVVAGQFGAPGQRDWAVLCSRRGVSSILVLWGGPVRCETPLPQTERADADCSAPGPGADGVTGSCRLLQRADPGDGPRESAAASIAADDAGEPRHDAVAESIGPRVRALHYCAAGTWRRVLSSR